MEEKKKLKHNYTSELELKSLLIRIKNEKDGIGTEDANSRINKYITWYTKINNKKYDVPTKRNLVKNRIKDKIIELSERTCVDKASYERFGEVILLMIKNILKKPNFSGYTYKDDFYSDAVYKILKYLHNFNHKLISKRTGKTVNSFAYISQYIHNSIIYIINTRKKDQDNLKKHIMMDRLSHNIEMKSYEWNQNHMYVDPIEEDTQIIEIVELKIIRGSLVNEIRKLSDEIDRVQRLEVIYPKHYSISFDEYNELKELLKGKVSITRAVDKNDN